MGLGSPDVGGWSPNVSRPGVFFEVYTSAPVITALTRTIASAPTHQSLLTAAIQPAADNGSVMAGVHTRRGRRRRRRSRFVIRGLASPRSCFQQEAHIRIRRFESPKRTRLTVEHMAHSSFGALRTPIPL